VVDLLTKNEATNGAAPPVGASDSEPALQDPTDVNDDVNVSGDLLLLELDEPVIVCQGSTSVTNGANDPGEITF
jgi:hypothetical protein